MKFPWHKYKELPLSRRNTLQIFITNACNLNCDGCFVRKVCDRNRTEHISLEEFQSVLEQALLRFEQINLLGGEPLLHPLLPEFIQECRRAQLKTTIYTNGYPLNAWNKEELEYAKLRVSMYSYDGYKAAVNIPTTHNHKMDANFMVSKSTTVGELLQVAYYMEYEHNCGVFFISSIRELDNQNKEFFEDTDLTMPVIEYKRIVHEFLDEYEGKMDIHVSKRGVFESTISLPSNKCCFSNYFVGGKIIYCPYDVVNLKFAEGGHLTRHIEKGRTCQHNNTCLMSKVIYRPKHKEI